MELEECFGVEELTIKRDLKELRSDGIDIHSVKNSGVELISRLETLKIKELLVQYLGLSYATNSYDKPTSLLVRKMKEKALSNVVLLQRCIEGNTYAKILYEKEADEKKSWREVKPIQFFQSENYWRILAEHEEIVKQFHLNKILDVEITERKFKKISKEEIDNMFIYSWKSWLGSEKINVRLKLSQKWASKLKPKQIMIYQDIEENADGSVELGITVNSLNEIASWIVSRGEGVVVLEPEELREKVISIARNTLGNYT
jgi:predicted DNA-binding transcriptional regulator YafY